MSEENIEVIRRAFDAFNRGDSEGVAAALAPGFEYVATGALVGAFGEYRGAEGFREFLDLFWEEFDEPKIQSREMIDADDGVLTWVTFRGRGRQSGVETSLDLWHMWTLQNGKAVRGRAFRSKREALEASVLRE
jgi:ketosteroid isomerase-like protein